MEVFFSPPAWSLPSIDPNAVSFLAYLEWIGKDYKIVECTLNQEAFIKFKRTILYSMTSVENLFAESTENGNVLECQSQAKAECLCSLIRVELHKEYEKLLWNVEENYNLALRPLLSFWNEASERRKHLSESIDFEIIHSKVCSIYKLLSDFLADKKYFFGNVLSRADFVIFGELVVHYHVPFTKYSLRSLLYQFPNLVEFVKDMEKLLDNSKTKSREKNSIICVIKNSFCLKYPKGKSENESEIHKSSSKSDEIQIFGRNNLISICCAILFAFGYFITTRIKFIKFKE